MADKSNMTEELDLLSDPEEVVVTPSKKDDKPPIEEGEEEDNTPTEDEDDDEEDSKLKESDEDDELDEELELASKPTWKSINEKYPDLKKDFPDLKNAFFKAHEYEQLFPTVEDAKQASEEIESYLNLRESVLSGDPTLLLNGLASTDKESYTLFARQFLLTLYKQDKELYNDTVIPIVETLLRNAYNEGVKHNNEELKAAAKLLTKAILEDEDIAEGKKTLVKPLNKPKEEEVTARESQAYNTAQSEVTEGILKGIRTEVRRGLDPKNAMTPFIRKSIIDGVIKKIDKVLAVDTRYQGTQSARWGKAKRSGYDEASKRQLISAALARAKTLVPELREKLRTAAFGKVKDEADDRRERIKERTPTRREVGGGRPPSSSRGKIDSNKIDWARTSDRDLFDDKVTYKN